MLALGFALLAAPTASAQWVTFQDQTASRLNAVPSLGSGDTTEKDYAWADLDQDGDIDLVCVRKQGWTTTGRFPNVLFMNVGGVLTDQTALYASASSVPGSQGFLDATNDRDVAIADVNGDGWLDVITATTLSGSQPKFISHPRIYINLGNDAQGNWQGLIFDDENRAPTMPAEPRFCAVSTGDVDGDGDVDLYFGDYQQGGSRPVDLNDRLWINDGTGYFTDETSARMTFEMVESSFGMATAIADMNQDGKLDILKDDALNAPQGVSISYNDTAVEGFFGSYEVVHNFAPYHISVGDLNNDTWPDIVVTDDGSDRYRLNTGQNTQAGLATFHSAITFTFLGGGFDDGFGGNSVIADLDNDGWNDVIITDVDVDIPGCSRRTHIYQNLGNAPLVTMREEQIGSSVAGIPISALTGTHDAAVFDIDGDGWNDLVLGRCSGTQVYINQPPIGLTFSYPQGLPFFMAPGQALTFQVQVGSIGGAVPAAGSAMLHYRLPGGSWTSAAMTDLGGNLYEATLPALTNCGDTVDFYVSAQTTGSQTYTDPSNAPLTFNTAIGATGTTVSYEENFEGVVTGWTVVNTALSTGAWEVAVPNGTISGGQQAAPFTDAEAGTNFEKCFVTQNGAPGGSAGAADVDGGPTELISPQLDLAGTDATISYSRWFFSSGSDVMNVYVSGDGVTWTLVESVGGSGNNQWTVASFRVSDYITPTATVQVKFSVADNPNNSITEAGIDVFRVEEFICSLCQQDIGYGGPGNMSLSVCGGNLSSGTTADVVLTGAPANALTYIIASPNLNPFGVGLGTVIDPFAPYIFPYPADANGEWYILGLPGGGGPLTLYLQVGVFDAGFPGGVGFSNAVQVDFLP